MKMKKSCNINTKEKIWTNMASENTSLKRLLFAQNSRCSNIFTIKLSNKSATMFLPNLLWLKVAGSCKIYSALVFQNKIHIGQATNSLWKIYIHCSNHRDSVTSSNPYPWLMNANCLTNIQFVSNQWHWHYW